MISGSVFVDLMGLALLAGTLAFLRSTVRPVPPASEPDPFREFEFAARQLTEPDPDLSWREWEGRSRYTTVEDASDEAGHPGASRLVWKDTYELRVAFVPQRPAWLFPRWFVYVNGSWSGRFWRRSSAAAFLLQVMRWFETRALKAHPDYDAAADLRDIRDPTDRFVALAGHYAAQQARRARGRAREAPGDHVVAFRDGKVLKVGRRALEGSGGP